MPPGTWLPEAGAGGGSGLEVGQTLRIFTSATLVSGITVFLTVLLGSRFLL